MESVDEEGGSSSNENVAELPVRLVELSSCEEWLFLTRTQRGAQGRETL